MEKKIAVLIVDDEKDICNSFKNYLEKREIIVDIALDGDRAKDLITTKTYDYIFFDFNLPGIPGIELPGIIKTHNPNAKKFMITGYDLVTDKFPQYLELDGMFRKPLSLEDLYKVIEK
ncbi:MAG: response regulator [Candidatus Omnitrophota bacterium]